MNSENQQASRHKTMNKSKDSTGGCCLPPPCSGLVVSLNHFEQYGPDGYENVIKTLIVHRETTVGEIIDWARKVTGAEKTGWPFTGPVHLAASDISPNDKLSARQRREAFLRVHGQWEE